MHPGVKSIHLVSSEGCAHCASTTMEPMREAALELGASFKAHDVETSEVKKADELVKKYGDWAPDYLVPQVFLEFEDGSFKHVLTGDPRGVAFTQHAVEEFLTSGYYSDLKAASKARHESKS